MQELIEVPTLNISILVIPPLSILFIVIPDEKEKYESLIDCCISYLSTGDREL